MNYQKIILVGNATSDAQSQTSKKGDVAYTAFGVGVSGDKDRTTFFPVVVFGQHGKALSKYITKGRQVLVEGRVAVSDKGRFNVVANRVWLGTVAEKPKKTSKRSRKTK